MIINYVDEIEEDILPSVKYDLPQNNKGTFWTAYPVYLEPGSHLVEITRTSVIPVLHFNETNTTLTISDAQKQQFYINSVSKIQNVLFTKNSSDFVPIGTIVDFVLSIHEGSSMNIHISEDHSLLNGSKINKVIDLTTGNFCFVEKQVEKNSSFSVY